MLLIFRFSSVESISGAEKIAWTFVRRLERLRLVLLRAKGQGRQSISLAVDFLSPAERHAGSDVKRPLAFSVPTRRPNLFA
jgi:hypothetical protein